MATLTIRLFGALSVQRRGLELEDIRGKPKELLCFLFLHRDQMHSREMLANLFWSDSTTVRSKKYLRQALWQLQQALEEGNSTDQNHILSVDSGHIRIDSRADYELDVAVMEDSFIPVRTIPGQDIRPEQAQALQRAINLYTGDLLEGWFQVWCLFERERLQNVYLSSLDKLMAYSEVHGEYEDGIVQGERMLRHDRARECAHLRLMRLRYLAGDRAGAIRQFHQCAAALQEELGVRPAKRTLELFEQIRADRLEERSATSRPIPAGSDAIPGLNMLTHLMQLRAMLQQVRGQIDQDLEMVERVLAFSGKPWH